MLRYEKNTNDGTIAITNQVSEPAQGTFIAELPDNTLRVEKGVIRPCLYNPVTCEREQEASVDTFAFGKEVGEGCEGRFYKVQLVGSQRCNLSYQTLLFSTRDPAEAIDWDTARFTNMTALDMLSNQDRRKVAAGIDPSMLITDMAPWDLISKFQVEGTRCTVYASELVPTDIGVDDIDSLITAVFESVGILNPTDRGFSWFMLLPDTAWRLQKSLGMTLDELREEMFLVHRDPALPDGTSLYPAKFAGVLKWGDTNAGEGIVMHPQDPYWARAGGDFDGDTAALYKATKFLRPYPQISRSDYRMSAKTYVSQDVGMQMVEAISDDTGSLLGPAILGLTRLIERDVASDSYRAIGSSVAQAAIDSKKHYVDNEATRESAGLILSAVQENSMYGEYPYISDFLNNLRNVSGVDAKIDVWNQLMDHINTGTWDNGSDVERAMVRRIVEINRIFDDVKWFRKNTRSSIPQSIKMAAVGKTSNKLADAFTRLLSLYSESTVALTMFDESSSRSEMEPFLDDVRRIRTMFKMACVTGKIGDLTVEPKAAQYAMIGYGPQKLAAQFVPAEVFEELSGEADFLFISLKDKGWKNGTYETRHIKPIPSCEGHWEVFSRGLNSVKLQVAGEAPRSTRVRLEAVQKTEES